MPILKTVQIMVRIKEYDVFFINLYKSIEVHPPTQKQRSEADPIK